MVLSNAENDCCLGAGTKIVKLKAGQLQNYPIARFDVLEESDRRHADVASQMGSAVSLFVEDVSEQGSGSSLALCSSNANYRCGAQIEEQLGLARNADARVAGGFDFRSEGIDSWGAKDPIEIGK